MEIKLFWSNYARDLMYLRAEAENEFKNEPVNVGTSIIDPFSKRIAMEHINDFFQVSFKSLKDYVGLVPNLIYGVLLKDFVVIS